MKKSKLFLICAAMMLPLFYSCSDDDKLEPGGLTPEQSAVKDLLEKAGRLVALPEKYEKTNISEEKSDELVRYKDETTMYQLGYAVKRTDHYSIVDNPMEFVTLDPWDILWPGALIQGKSLTEGIPAGVPIISKRRPGKIYLSLVSGNAEMDTWFKEVPMSGAYVTQAMNELLSKHLNANPARTAFEIETVNSTEELSLKLGVNLKLWGSKLNQSFGGKWDKKKSYVAVKLNQIFFTMAYEGPDGGFQGAFTDDITADDLKYFTGPDNPICYINSVSYGRSYIMLYESEESSRALEMAVKAAFMKQDINANSTEAKTFNRSKCKLVQIGGDPVAGLETAFGDFQKLRDFVEDGAVVSAKNIGVPISYKISHLVDNSTVRLSNTLDYEFTSQTFLPQEPMNNVVIDFFNAYMPAPTSKRTVSNYSTMTLKRVSINEMDISGNYKRGYELLEKPITNSTKGQGANIPIYHSTIFQKVNPKNRIRIEAELYVKNQTYGGSTHMNENTFRLVRDFEFDAQKNAWSPVEEEKNNSFNQLSIHEDNFGDATMDFQLNFRFNCDGMVYPIGK